MPTTSRSAWKPRSASPRFRNAAFPFSRVGSKISADSLEDPRTGLRYFSLEVVVPPQETAKIEAVRADGGLRAELPAEVLIPLRKRSALTYLFEPLTQTLWKAGREH